MLFMYYIILICYNTLFGEISCFFFVDLINFVGSTDERVYYTIKYIDTYCK